MPVKRRFQVFLEEQQLTALRSIEQRTGASVAELIRRAIDAYLLKQNDSVQKKGKRR